MLSRGEQRLAAFPDNLAFSMIKSRNVCAIFIKKFNVTEMLLNIHDIHDTITLYFDIYCRKIKSHMENETK